MTSDTSSGYTLFAPMEATTTYLIDNFGRRIHSWPSTKTPGASVYLLEDGSILRCESLQNRAFNSGGSAGRLKRISWDGKTTWTYDYSDSSHCQHHDCEPLPNGNVLFIAWEYKSKSEANAAGRSTSHYLWPGHLIEVEPSGSSGGEIVWEWHVWDHLVQDKDENKDNYGVVADHPELVDANYVEDELASIDWMHTNAVDYNADLDQILLSVRHFNEVWIIDHSTTTAEAASHSGGTYGKGGDLLYRFGNPAAYKSGSSSDRLLDFQHDAHWIPKGLPGAGNILVFNNGYTSRNYSSVDEFKLPVDDSGKYDMNEAAEHVWSYTSDGFFATVMSGAQRMINGNTLICHGPKGTFFEVDADKNSVWEYISPVTNSGIVQQHGSVCGDICVMTQPNECFRALRYTRNYAAFEDKDIPLPDTALEGGSIIPVSSSDDIPVHTPGEFTLSSYTHPSHPASKAAITITIPRSTDVTVKIYSADGQEVATLINQYLSVGKYSYTCSADGCAGGMYIVRLVTKNYAAADRIFLLQ